MGEAEKDPAFQQTYKSYIKRVVVEDHNPNFYAPAVCELWARMPDAPQVVRRYAAVRRATDTRIESIVASQRWPQRTAVGDEAAADFFFLFGHADDDNSWRLTQVRTIDRVFREDHVNPRMYAYLCDRLANVDDKPQIYGSVMGPGRTPGTARLYWPVLDGVAAANRRRMEIGLSSTEGDLGKYREAQISAHT